MFFLLRSIFWLTIVFTSMSWTVDEVRPGSHSGSRVLSDAIAESGSALAGAARQAALTQIEAQATDGAGDQTQQFLEKAALTYLSGKSSAQAVRTQAVPIQARAWCVAADDVCARDAARLTALIAANQSDEADDNSGGGMLPSPRHRAAVRITTHKNS